MSILLFIGIGAAVISIFMVGLWLVSLKSRDVSIIDRAWGLNFIVLATTYAALAPQLYWRSVLVWALVFVWGLRLSLHIHLRNRGKPEDFRYQKMRIEQGEPFWWKSLFRVFLLQGALALIISAPILWVFYSSPDQSASLWDLTAVVLWMVGFYFEAVGDLQLVRFKNDPKNNGKLLTSGLWSVSRHPNYFGDALQWWGLFLFTLNFSGGIFTAVGPMVMSLFLRYVSGVTLLEKSLKKSKPGYERYIEQTPAFIPNLHIMDLTRLLFFLGVKCLTRIVYRFEVKLIGEWPKNAWDDIRIAILLNHTSLIEPIFCSVLPLGYLWKLAARGVFPVAEETMQRPIVGRFIRLLAPKVGMLTRKRDSSWEGFVAWLSEEDSLVFLPEGRMKRPNGLDKHGRPMTVKRGVTDILIKMASGKLLFAYSGGLHHVQSPGQGFPKLFKTIKISFEVMTIENYLAEIESKLDSKSIKQEYEKAQELIVKDLEERRDKYC